MKTSCLCECLFAPLSMAGGLQLPLPHLENLQVVTGYLHGVRGSVHYGCYEGEMYAGPFSLPVAHPLPQKSDPKEPS